MKGKADSRKEKDTLICINACSQISIISRVKNNEEAGIYET